MNSALAHITPRSQAFRENVSDFVTLNDNNVVTWYLYVLNPVLGYNAWVFRKFDELINVLATEFGFDYEAAINVVWNRTNWNRCKLFGGSNTLCTTNKAMLWSDKSFLPIQKVNSIINYYVNESTKKDSTLPEYKPDQNDKQVIALIARGAGVSEKEAREVMTQAYFAFADGQLPSDFITRPKQFLQSKDARQTPEEADSIHNTIGSTVDGFITALKWIGIAVGVGAIVYFTAPIWSSKR